MGEVRLEAQLGIGGIVDHDRHGLLELVLELDVERLAQRRIGGELRGRAVADLVVGELGAVRFQLVVDRTAEELDDVIGLVRHPIEADLRRRWQRAAVVALRELRAHAQDHDVVDHADALVPVGDQIHLADEVR